MGADFGSTQACDNIERFDAQCCNFVVVDDPAITGQFCISNSQRETDFTGTYRDYDYTLWKWECKEPVNDGPNEKDSSAEAFELPVYSNYNDLAMEWILWVVYLSQTVYLLGLFVSLPLGWGVLAWLQIVSIVQLFELFGGVGDFGSWVHSSVIGSRSHSSSGPPLRSPSFQASTFSQHSCWAGGPSPTTTNTTTSCSLAQRFQSQLSDQ